MAFKINDFKTQAFTDGGARPSLFQIEIPDFPSLPGGSVGIDAKAKLSFLAKASSLPASIMPEIDVGYMGRKIKVLGDRIFPNWSITVYNMEDFSIRNMFEDWHELMNGREPNIMFTTTTNPQNYKKDITVVQYSKLGNEKKVYTMVGAFPVSIGAISLDYDATNQIELFDVEFAYDYWQPIRENAGSIDGPVASFTSNPGI